MKGLSIANPEEVLKVICGGDEICDIFEVGLDGEQKTLESVVRWRAGRGPTEL
jgi:hypothetical protein